ncbi:divergent polysaccharide deacetylase family protein [Desulfobotulus sp. H1]|uniref:Divergent polysaccharide deacetylase family protein n=1 Tax=Desulfobotulus pelophilus TaxID=2823377 RepID=A0ABT3N995_9BACT|nr:divergent polysaccharide deacetylase family protein [Desulfobotulus pelophilus]MCW7754026.1 divergent polysaccharide deacetylase family protein [Desulfobotulus pelophilus]
MTKKKETKPAAKKPRSSGSGKKSGKSSPSGGKKKTAAPRKEVNQGPMALLILLVLVLGIGVAAHLYFQPSGTILRVTEKKSVPSSAAVRTHKEPSVSKPVAPTRAEVKARASEPQALPPALPVQPLPQKEHTIPKYEVFPGKEAERKRPEIPREKLPEKPVIAIIIDDIGYDRAIAEELMALDIPLTFSVLPHSPYGVRIANRVHEKGHEVMLHLPMEPVEYPRINPGPGGLLLAMEPDELLGILDVNLAAIPHIRGVNNHMGSGLTQSESHINQIFTILKKKDLFFIDSRTAAKSRCRSAARLFQLPFAERDVFLDHIQHKDAVDRELSRLFRIADKHGSALGIGHPHRVTLEGLRKRLPEAREKYSFVYASDMVSLVE